MEFNGLGERLRENEIAASDGSHSLRVWRIAENLNEHATDDPAGDRLSHLMSRVGVFARSLAKDLRSGQTSPNEAAVLLDYLADIGDIAFEHWRPR